MTAGREPKRTHVPLRDLPVVNGPLSVPALAAVLFLIAFVHGAGIMTIPGFFSDDLYIFARFATSVIPNDTGIPSNLYFLDTRILTYLTFRAEAWLFGVSAAGMKLFGLFIFLASVATLSVLVRRLLTFFGAGVSPLLTAVVICFYGIHHSNVVSVLWISNQNETLMALFYMLALIGFLGLLEPGKPWTWYAVGAVGAFTASVLFKQQGIHLPLLFGAAAWYSWKQLPAERRRAVAIVVLVSVIIMAAAVWFNAWSAGDAPLTTLVSSLWKKPFSMIGVLASFIMPVRYHALYDLFLEHPSAAIGIFIALLLIVGTVFLRTKKAWRYAGTFLLLLGIIFFPRMLDAGDNDRINTIQMIWFCIGMVLLSARSRYRSFMTVLLVLFTAGHVYGTMQKVLSLERSVGSLDRMVRSLSAEQGPSHEPVTVLMAPEITNLSAWSHFHRTGTFGFDTTISVYPFYFVTRKGYAFRHDTAVIVHSLADDTLTLTSLDPNVMITHKQTVSGMVLSKETVRRDGARKVTILIPHDTAVKKRILYYNGRRWTDARSGERNTAL